MNPTQRYALPLLQAGQAQKEVTHNEALARLDSLLHLAVESRTQAAAPLAVAGQAWIVPATAVGLWAGHDGAIAASDEGGWTFIAPRVGCIAFVRDEQAFISWAGSWRDGWPVRSIRIGGRDVLAAPPVAIARPTGGATIDIEARAAIAALTSALQAAGVLAGD